MKQGNLSSRRTRQGQTAGEFETSPWRLYRRATLLNGQKRISKRLHRQLVKRRSYALVKIPHRILRTFSGTL